MTTWGDAPHNGTSHGVKFYVGWIRNCVHMWNSPLGANGKVLEQGDKYCDLEETKLGRDCNWAYGSLVYPIINLIDTLNL